VVVPLFRENVRLEPMQCRGERDARFPPLAGGQHPKRWVFGQPLGVVGVLVAGQPAVDRLAEEVQQRKLPIVSGARIREVPLDQGVKAETFVQLAREQQPGIGGDGGSAELDAKLRIEREPNRARCRVTHWMMPSGPARSRREPPFLRVLRDYGPIRLPLKMKMGPEVFYNRRRLHQTLVHRSPAQFALCAGVPDYVAPCVGVACDSTAHRARAPSVPTERDGDSVSPRSSAIDGDAILLGRGRRDELRQRLLEKTYGALVSIA
jgi:hypothetical protein